MISIIVPLTEEVIDRAFLLAEREDTDERRKIGVLYKSGIPEVDSAAISALERIQELMKETAQKGWEAVKQKFHDVVNYIYAKAKSLGERGIAFKNQVLEDMKKIMNNTYDLLLGTLRNEIVIGDATFEMETVEIIHSLKLSGNLEIGLETLCKFAASGEIGITGTYSKIPKS